MIGDRLLLHNALVGGSTLLAGVLGFAFQALISHKLQPSDYAGVFGAMTLLMLITLPAAALTLLMARESSRDRALGHHEYSAALLRGAHRLLLACGIALGLVVVAASPWIAGFLNTPRAFVLAAAASLPVALASPLLMGEVQGQQRFSWLSWLTVGQAALKLVAAVALGAIVGPIGVIEGLAVASTLAYLVVRVLVRRKLRMRVSADWLQPALRYLALVIPSTLSLSVLLSADVLLVNHFFTKTAAGEYSAVAALGRAIYWGAAGVGIVLFPKVIFHEVQGRSSTGIVMWSIGLVAVGGTGGLLLLSASSKVVLTAFSGNAYSGGATYLAGYAVAMILFGCASVLVAVQQSRSRPGFLLVLIPIAVAEPAAIAAFHHNVVQVVQVLNVSMTVLVAGLALFLVRRSPLSEGRPLTVAPPYVPVEVNA